MTSPPLLKTGEGRRCASFEMGENKVNKEKAPELPVLINVAIVSSGVSSRSKFREQWQKA